MSTATHNTLCLNRTHGRISLELRCHCLGQDLQICLTGGTAHLGAVALALPGADRPAILIRPGHREDELAALMAETLARGLGCAVCVSAGIHYPHISKDEISAVERLSQELTMQCLHALTDSAMTQTRCCQGTVTPGAQQYP